MKIHDVYPSQWLAAADVEDCLTVTVKGLTFAEVGRDKEQKPVLWFEEVEKGLILNKTNWNNMVLITKEADSDDWVGHQVQLYSTKVQFGSDEVDAVKIIPLADYEPVQVLDLVDPPRHDGCLVEVHLDEGGFRNGD